ncbi:fumarylacetoacetate hydrolase family protein [Streptomyces sp. HGB0020]|uniref:fumarylacetoacetate hydrolase family protein n=1 Tax=Streptomyces sp. HGB0020 TaxID=1078086 RepID=UPI00034EA739|nr:fumarylacetoacetate hydrolase family protein [Streptomyces sp. HGB0020]EPD54432.1 hypothetical protein HMPREF1211_08554 [Streptomyces sp. HGB0020]
MIAHDCSNLDAATAEQHIAGYLVHCDWTPRDLTAGQMGLVHGPSKNKDSSFSLGPFLVTPDELEPKRSGKGYAPWMNAPCQRPALRRRQLGRDPLVVRRAAGTRLPRHHAAGR